MAPHSSEGIHLQRHESHLLTFVWRSLKQQRWLIASWVLLLAMSMLALILYIVATPVYFARLLTPRLDCNDECLTPAKAHALHALGISISTYAGYWVGINLLFALVYCMVAALIFWRKPGDPVAWFASFSLLTLATSFPSTPNALVAAGLIAVLFQPIRERLQRLVNRLMYGERDEPYRVISRLGERLEATLAPDAVLSVIVEAVAQALKLPYAAISLQQERASSIAASYGTKVEPLFRLPLLYQSEQVGELLLAPRGRGESFTLADRRLLDDLARQAGIAVHAVRLTADLQQSRERLVTAREEERRRLRRDLHDGLGPVLASITLKLDAARNLLTRDPPAADALLIDLKKQTQAAVADIRRLIYELRPPSLDELGLIPALREQVEQYIYEGLRITIDAPELLPPLPAAVEVATYRIVQAAMTNVLRHAQARTCIIRFVLNNGLEIEICDDGRGIAANQRAGVGLTSIRERAAELGGLCEIEAVPSDGTRLHVRLPLPRATEREE